MRVFLSSTYEDLVEYRAKAALAIERLGQQDIRMEVFGARTTGATEACLNEIEASDAFIGIYAHRYGFIPPNATLSITEQEFDFARSKNKPTFCFVLGEDYPWPPRYVEGSPGKEKLTEFKRRLAEKIVWDTFTTPDDLAFKVSSSLGRHLITTNVIEGLTRANKFISTPEGRTQVARRAARLASLISGTRLLLVNDIPSQMAYVTDLITKLGMQVTIATSTDEAISALRNSQIDIVVSDMARGNIPDDGIKLLRRMQQSGLHRPTILSVGKFEPDRGTPAYCFGITNRIDELLNYVFDAIERIKG